jgi:hypothetical protein
LQVEWFRTFPSPPVLPNEGRRASFGTLRSVEPGDRGWMMNMMAIYDGGMH